MKRSSDTEIEDKTKPIKGLPRNLKYHTRYMDLIELKEWISELDSQTLLTNNLIASKVTNSNKRVTNMSSCGLTSQAIMNLLIERNGGKFSDVKPMVKWDKKMLQKNNIILVGMDACNCCRFLGHAFLIYCSNDICYIIQSFISQYYVDDFFDTMTFEKIDKFMSTFADMYTNGINDKTLKQLHKFTHVNHEDIRNCELKGSEFQVYCFENEIGFKK